MSYKKDQAPAGKGAFKAPSLRALTAAALALPGLAAAQADGLQVDYQFSHYQERDLPASRNVSGRPSERYEVESHQVRMSQPFGERQLTAEFLYETLSGASPWFVLPDAEGDPVQVMSGPTITEERYGAQISGSSPINDEWSGTLSGGFSEENDYRSGFGGGELSFRPNNGRLTYIASASLARDRIRPTQGATPVGVIQDFKTAHQFNIGAAYVLNPRTWIQGSIGYQNHRGYLSDPYKAVFIVDDASTVFDNRPRDRQGIHAMARLRHFNEQWQGAWHVDYRYYDDDWDVRSHTLEITWHQTLSEHWQVSPGVRWYSQTEAFFYAPFFQTLPNDGFVSSDYRLSPFGAISLRLDAQRRWDRWTVTAGVEQYRASASYSLESVAVEAPGIVGRYVAINLGVSLDL